MIIDFIEKLQNKPRHERIRIMWLAVFVSMVLIFSFWVVYIKHLVQDNSGKPLISEDAAKKVQDIKKTMPTDNLKAGINSLFQQSDVKNSPFEK